MVTVCQWGVKVVLQRRGKRDPAPGLFEGKAKEMFGSKSRKIKKLEESLQQEMTNSRLMFKSQEGKIRELEEAKVGLTADRDRARESVDILQGQIPQLKIDRDLASKRVEELEEEVRRRQTHPPAIPITVVPEEEELNSSISKESLGFEN